MEFHGRSIGNSNFTLVGYCSKNELHNQELNSLKFSSVHLFGQNIIQ